MSGREPTTTGTPGTRRGAAASLPEWVSEDLQSLLSSAVERLRETTGCEAAAAWTLRTDGEPTVVAASFTGPAPASPDAAAFAAAAELPGATALDEAALPAKLRDLAGRHRFSAAAPIPASDGRPAAILFLRGAVRPRHLAALDACAQKLATPLGAALALGRLRALDGEIRRLDRLAALGQLAAEIAHEVRNPLVSMKTFLQLLPERRDDPELLTDFLELVKDELRRVERLLDLVMTQARPSQPSPAARPGAVLESMAELLRHRALRTGVTLETQLEAVVPAVALDEDALRQVVLNLALNALEVTPDGGTIHLSGRRRGDHVELAVADEGPGIPEALRGAVFEPFFSTRPDRSGGLGLAITRRIVEEAGGRISIEGGEKGGTVFRVQIPRDAGAETPSRDQPPRREPSQSKAARPTSARPVTK
jgi:signal transduction histidine kinase